MSNFSLIGREIDPFPIYRQMRAESPVYFDPERHNWNVFRFADVQRLLSEHETFSSQFAGRRDSDSAMPFAASMISTDPPRHRMLRGLVSQAFTPRSVEALAPRITAIVDEHLDAVLGVGEMDVIRDLGYPLPVIVTAEMLGVPAADRERFKHWSDTIVQMADFGGTIDPQRMMSPEIMEMGAYFFDMLDRRRQSPGDDLISGLLAAELEGERLSQIELLGFCMLLLVAGNETTTNLIGNAILTLTEYPEAWERLRAEPALLPQAIEEALRYRSPVQSMFRVAKEDTEIAGQTVPAGGRLVAWIGSANHDEAQFPEAEKFDVARTANRHLAFGQGIHYCLGAPLARLEARIALGAMLERFSSISLAQGAALERLPSLLVYGLKRLPVDFEPA